MKINVFNKILLDHRPIEKVCSKDEIVWITAKVTHEGKYEDQFNIYYKV